MIPPGISARAKLVWQGTVGGALSPREELVLVISLRDMFMLQDKSAPLHILHVNLVLFIERLLRNYLWN